VGPRAGLNGRKISPPTDFLKLQIYCSFGTQIQWLNGRYLSNVLLTEYFLCVRIALFVCYSKPFGERRYGSDVIGRRSPCRYGTVTQLSCT